MSNNTNPRVWITYAWKDNEEGDFSYLVQELSAVGVEAKYDRIAIIPGRDLWDQIANEIANGDIDGWAYLITPNSLASEPCREELAYALSRALNTRGRNFPLMGLLHGVRIQDVPPALKVRLCVSLANPNWKEEIKAGIEGRPPQVPSAPQTQYVWRIHQGFGGVAASTAIEVRPRFGEIMYWRFAVPTSASVTSWGHGPSGGGSISGSKSLVVKGGAGALMNGTPINWFGAGDRLSPGISAYVVCNEAVPEFIAFGLASEAHGPPQGQMEVKPLR
jgi:hypothetical protein